MPDGCVAFNHVDGAIWVLFSTNKDYVKRVMVNDIKNRVLKRRSGENLLREVPPETYNFCGCLPRPFYACVPCAVAPANRSADQLRQEMVILLVVLILVLSVDTMMW